MSPARQLPAPYGLTWGDGVRAIMVAPDLGTYLA